MAQTYGYQPQRLGYGYSLPTQKPQTGFNTRSLAMAAGSSTPTDPFGLTTGQAGAKGYFNVNPVQPATPQSTVTPAATTPGVSQPTGGTDTTAGKTAGPPPPGTVFDINSVPAVQSATALIGQNNANAQSTALSQKQLALIGYGDPALIQKVLGDPTLAEAAAKNPTSVLAQLHQQHDRGLTDMTENFNKQNLLYSGARVKGEQQFGEDYQNALASAAANVNNTLSGIDSNLASSKAQGNTDLVNALMAAYAANPQQGGVPGADAANALSGGSSIPSTNPEDSYWKLLGLAKAAGGQIGA